MASEITRVSYTWSDQIGAAPAWYCQVWGRDRILSDSQKIDFPVDTEAFGEDDHESLITALAEAFPGVAIESDNA